MSTIYGTVFHLNQNTSTRKVANFEWPCIEFLGAPGACVGQTVKGVETVNGVAQHLFRQQIRLRQCCGLEDLAISLVKSSYQFSHQDINSQWVTDFLSQ